MFFMAYLYRKTRLCMASDRNSSIFSISSVSPDDLQNSRHTVPYHPIQSFDVSAAALRYDFMQVYVEVYNWHGGLL